MKIKKIGHCCLVIELKGPRILTDPGSFTSEKHKNISEIDVIFITHEHGDHLHTESLKEILENNPKARVFTNSGVGKILDEAEIKYEILEGRNSTNINGLNVEAFDAKHVEIYEELGQVQNTGYFFGDKLFYPGDAYANPEKPVDILALPVSGPWCKISEAIRYALEIKPNKAFPVHDGTVKIDKLPIIYRIPTKVLGDNNIKFIEMVDGDEKEF
jgi:L-ascorbate metabolism protein UlaG (beta-lactamase superfamily)